MPDHDVSCEIPFGDPEAIALHQLHLLEWMHEQCSDVDHEDKKIDEQSEKPAECPEDWCLTNDVKLYPWQEECVDKWMQNHGRGTVKVVTGGGKTMLALAIAERLQQTEKDLRVAIVVPTIVLMHQWYDELRNRSNIPQEFIGRLGGSYKDNFGDDQRILITVLKSASAKLPATVTDAGVAPQLLLIADECHRTGAAIMSKVFDAHPRWTLGLSATPERDDTEEHVSYNESKTGQALGEIIFEFNLVDALREGLVPKFTINHYGLPLNAAEQNKYDKLSRSISDSRKELQSFPGYPGGGGLFAWAQTATKGSGEKGVLARRFLADASKRKSLLVGIEARSKAVVQLVENEFSINRDAQIIMFHESIDEAMQLFVELRRCGFPVVAEHSKLPDSVRQNGLDLFRRGIAKIIVSVKSLIEGFNVPACDVGIVVASSTSERQRVQSLGRVLRRHRGKAGEEKTSSIYVLYAANTTEEILYQKTDWNKATGVDQNLYFLWDLEAEPAVQEGPPRTPLPKEDEIDESQLEPGSPYPGEYEGEELSVDTQGNIKNASGQFAKETGKLAENIRAAKGNSAGKFRATSKKHLVLVRVSVGGDWETKFVEQLSEPLSFSNETKTVEVDSDEWIKTAAPGAPYPQSEPKIIETVKYKQSGGGKLAKKIRNGEAYARRGEKANDQGRGQDAETLIEAIQALRQKENETFSKVDITESLDAVYRKDGSYHFIARLQHGLEFKE